MFNRPNYKFHRGEHFKDWRLLQPLGIGAFGEVHMAEDITGKKVALKILTKTSAEKSQRELDALSHYQNNVPRHENLIPVFHAGRTDDGLVYYTMELADDLRIEADSYIPDTLENRLKWKKTTDPVEILAIINGILSGLVALHQVGASHRDLKPANIIFIKNVPILADIGLLSFSSDQYQPGGTLDFLPPEIRNGTIRGSENQMGGDIYACGMILYCILSGQLPEEYPIIPPDLPVETIRLIRPLYARACDRRPARRYMTAQDFLDALDKTRKQLSTVTYKFKHRWFCFFVIFVLVLGTFCVMKGTIFYQLIVARGKLVDHEHEQLTSWFFPDSFLSIEQLKYQALQFIEKNPGTTAVQAINEILIIAGQSHAKEKNVQESENKLFRYITIFGKGDLYRKYEAMHNAVMGNGENLFQDNYQKRIMLAGEISVNPAPVIWILNERVQKYGFINLMEKISEDDKAAEALSDQLTQPERLDRICQRYTSELENCVASLRDLRSICALMAKYYPNGEVSESQSQDFEQALENFVNNSNLE